MVRHDIEYLRSRLEYQKDTGVFLWKEKQVGTIHDKSWNTRYANKVAGTVGLDNYIRVKLDGVQYQGHILAWAIYYGVWPDQLIDHRDGNEANNAIDNLRLASGFQNQANRKVCTRNTSGYKGVSYRSTNDTWYVRIQCKGKTYSKSGFKNPEDANAYAKTLRIELAGEFARDC